MTKRSACDKITGLLMKSFGSEATKNHKKVFKNLKKFLTNSKRCVNIKQFAADARAAAKSELTVPCKLNNARQTITPWTIYGLFKKSCIRRNYNSQRKFLSIFAKTNLFKNLI